jgi:hypothetical protein
VACGASGAELAPAAPFEPSPLAWWLVLLTLSSDEMLHLVPQVSRGFRRMSEEALKLASLLGCVQAGTSSPLVKLPQLMEAFPRGQFLAEGGCAPRIGPRDGRLIESA